VFVELHAGIGILDCDDRPQTVCRFHYPGTNLEPLHHGLLATATGRVGQRNPKNI
jgi:hypothetical protein